MDITSLSHLSKKWRSFTPPWPHRVLAICVAALFVWVLNGQFVHFQEVREKRRRVERLIDRASLIVNAVTPHLDAAKKSDPYYLEKVLEPMVFLEGEIEALKAIAAHPAFENWESIDKRLQFLNSPANHLQFSEKNRQKRGAIEEVEVELLHPIQGDLNDLHRLLVAIEGVTIPPYNSPQKRPQLIIKRFDLKKGKAFSSKEIYHINLSLIKRDIPS